MRRQSDLLISIEVPASVVILSGGVRSGPAQLHINRSQEIMSGSSVVWRGEETCCVEQPGAGGNIHYVTSADMLPCWHVKRLQYNTNTKSYPWLQFPLTVQFFCSWSLELNVCRVRRENINKQTEQTTQTDQYLCLVTTPTTIRVLIKQFQTPPFLPSTSTSVLCSVSCIFWELYCCNSPGKKSRNWVLLTQQGPAVVQP